MKDALTRLIRHHFSSSLATVVAVAEAVPIPPDLRRRLHERWGVRQGDAVVERGARFANRYVSLGDGAFIGRQVRFEGAANIEVFDGVELRGPVTVTSRVEQAGSLWLDHPVQVRESIDAQAALVIRPEGVDRDGR